MNAVVLDFGTIEILQTIKQTQEKSVFLARNALTHEEVILRTQTQESQAYQLLSLIRHEHLTKVLWVQQLNGTVYIVEEYVRGKLLSDVIQEGPLEKRDVIRIGVQLCSALEALHKAGIVHRDVKPENVLLLEDGTIKLFDYDAARIYKIYASGDTTLLGTVGFAAPEQFGLTQSDARSDIYSLGILLNILLTGVHPTVKLCGGRMLSIVLRCIRVNPERRYQSVGQVCRRLKWMKHSALSVAIPVLALLLAVLLIGKAAMNRTEENANTADAGAMPAVTIPPLPSPHVLAESDAPQEMDKPVYAVETEAASEPVEETVFTIGAPLSGRTQELILNGEDRERNYPIKFGVEQVYIYYRGADNRGLTAEEAQRYTARIAEKDGLSPWAELTHEVVKMDDSSDRQQLKMTLSLSNVTCDSQFAICIDKDGTQIQDFALYTDASHFKFSRNITIDGKTVRLSLATLDGGIKIEEGSLPIWVFQSDQEAADEYGGPYRMVVGAFSGEHGSTETVAMEETWAYEYIRDIEVVQIYNDENNIMYLGKVHNSDPANRGFDIMRSISSGFVEVAVKVNFVEALNMDPVVLTMRYTSHEEEIKRTVEKRPENDTVEALNKFLAEFDYSSLQDNLIVELASTPYYGTIVIPEQAYDFTRDDGHTVYLDGYWQDGSKTTIYGTLECKGYSGAHRNLRFVAPEKSDEQEQTIAVKAVAGDMGGISLYSCEFIGYDIAVYCNGSYILPTDNNVFRDNGIGIYMDAEGFTAPRGYKHIISSSWFLNNGTAVCLKSLPDNIQPKDFRISENIYVGNETDIVSEIEVMEP